MDEMTKVEALEKTVRSLLDVVEELCAGLAYGQTPQKDWSAVVQTSFEDHRKELREAS